jgi:hypothetical protein
LNRSSTRAGDSWTTASFAGSVPSSTECANALGTSTAAAAAATASATANRLSCAVSG